MGSGSIEPIEPTRPIPPPAKPELTPTRRAASAPFPEWLQAPRVRGQAPDRAGTYITGFVVNLDVHRVALSTPEGPPIRGDIDTDLAPGCYSLKPDPVKEQWVFEPHQVNSGLRFNLLLDGSLPFTLRYAEALWMIVGHGLSDARATNLEAARKEVEAAVAGKDYVLALDTLSLLNDVDLYDLLDTLDGTEFPGELLLHFEAGLKDHPGGIGRILRALESYVQKPDRLFVDAFDKCFIHPSSFARDEKREKQRLSNIKLVFTYDLKPARAIMLYADDIVDGTARPQRRPTYGEAGLFYPEYFSRGMTPRMWEARKQKLAEMELQNVEFITTSYQAVEKTISLVLLANSLLVRTIPAASGAATAARGLSRPISEAYERQPGRWELDFEGGTNMSEAAAEYQARVCGTDRYMNYRVNGVRFDGHDLQGNLLDAKHWLDHGRKARLLARPHTFSGIIEAEGVLREAEAQVAAAGGRTIEWRVAGQVATGQLGQLFRVNRIPIRVVHVP